MRFVASAYSQDTRPEKVEGRKAPEGGWRTKSGVRKLGKKAQMECKTLGEAVTKAAEMFAKLSPANAKKVVRVVVAVDKADPDSGANPWEESEE